MYIQKAVLQIRIRDQLFFRLPDTVSRSGMAKNPEPGSRNPDEHPRSVIWFKNSVADPDPKLGPETFGRIRIRSGTKISISDPDSNPDSPPKCRQSARLFSSCPNWDSPTPSPAAECVLPSFGSGGVGGHNSDEGTDTVVLMVPTYGIYAQCVHRHGEGHYTQTICIYVWEAA